MHCGQALRCAWAWLRASWLSAISGASRPSASLGRGLRPAVAPSGLSSASARCAHPPEKALYCPFLKEGVRNVARNIVGEITLTFVRARAHSFPLSKRARLFPSAAYRRSAPPPLGWGRRSNSAGWATFAWGGRFCKAIGQKGFQIILAFAASHETFRRVAVCNGQSAGDRTRPASREARCRAAALGTKATETRGLPPSVSRAPYLSA